jgi:hypothetical protein
MRLRGVKALVVAGVLAAAGAPAARAASLSSAHVQAPAGGTVRVTGEGFGAGEHVHFAMEGADAGGAVADGGGALAQVAVAVPPQVAPGYHPLVATGADSGATASLTIWVRTDWAQTGFRAGLSNVNPFERPIGAGQDGVVYDAQRTLRAFPLRCRADGAPCTTATVLDPYVSPEVPDPLNPIEYGSTPVVADGTAWVIGSNFYDTVGWGFLVGYRPPA